MYSLEGDREALLQSHVMRQKKMLSNLAPLTDGSIPPGNPDRAYGAPASDLDRSVRLELDELVVPTREKNFICPNFIVHVKSNKGDATVAMAQAAYDGALAARGMQALWDFGGGPDMASGIQTPRGDTGDSTAALGVRSDGVTDSSPGHEDRARVARVARTITCTWTTGVLKMYATYCEVNPNPGEGALSTSLEPGFPKYVPSSIGSWIMTDKENQFRDGLAAYRNGLDWAKRQRDMVISRANARVRAEQARRRRGEEEEAEADEEEDVDEGGQSGGEGDHEEEPNVEQENQFEDEDNTEENDGGLSSIFARQGSGAGGQDEEHHESDPADENLWSFDSQRTVTTRSMRRRQERGRRP